MWLAGEGVEGVEGEIGVVEWGVDTLGVALKDAAWVWLSARLLELLVLGMAWSYQNKQRGQLPSPNSSAKA